MRKAFVYLCECEAVPPFRWTPGIQTDRRCQEVAPRLFLSSITPAFSLMLPRSNVHPAGLFHFLFSGQCQVKRLKRPSSDRVLAPLPSRGFRCFPSLALKYRQCAVSMATAASLLCLPVLLLIEDAGILGWLGPHGLSWSPPHGCFLFPVSRTGPAQERLPGGLLR